MAKRRVAKSVRIEGDDRRDISILFVNVRCKDVLSSCSAQQSPNCLQAKAAKDVVVGGYGV